MSSENGHSRRHGKIKRVQFWFELYSLCLSSVPDLLYEKKTADEKKAIVKTV